MKNQTIDKLLGLCMVTLIFGLLCYMTAIPTAIKDAYLGSDWLNLLYMWDSLAAGYVIIFAVSLPALYALFRSDNLFDSSK